MRNLVALAVTSAFLAACGDSSNGSAAPPPTTPLSGRIGGRTFTPAAVQAITAGSGTSPCVLPGVGSLGVRAIELAITSYADACGDLASVQCRWHQNAQSVTVLVARANAAPPNGEPALPPGTYTVRPSITTATPDPANPAILNVAYAEAVAPDPTCAGTAHPAASGTVRLDETTGPITGRLDLTFDDGSTLAGDFTAALCPGVTPNVCARALGGALCTQPPACIP